MRLDPNRRQFLKNVTRTAAGVCGGGIILCLQQQKAKAKEEAYKDVTKLLSENEKFLHDMANALLEEETIDAKAVDNLYKYGTTKAPEVEESKEALEAAGIVVPEVVEAKENTATVDAPSETPSNEIK